MGSAEKRTIAFLPTIKLNNQIVFCSRGIHHSQEAKELNLRPALITCNCTYSIHHLYLCVVVSPIVTVS